MKSQKSSRVMIVDDEEEMCSYLVSGLSDLGLEAFSVSSGEEALQAIQTEHLDIILMDVRLPGQSGVVITEQIKSNKLIHDLPIIMISGVDTEEAKVQALDLGADDYLVKPFQINELAARIRAVLRRGAVDKPVEEAPMHYQEGQVTLDLASHRIFYQEQEVRLTLTEFKILHELIRHKGKVLSRNRLRESALGNFNVTDRTIDVHMASLRKKLAPWSQGIHTIRGVGYRYS